MKTLLRSALLAVLALAVITPLHADERARKVSGEGRVTIEVAHDSLTAIWVEITSDSEESVASWFITWDGRIECIEGICPDVMEIEAAEGIAYFEVTLPAGKEYGVEVISPGTVWHLDVKSE